MQVFLQAHHALSSCSVSSHSGLRCHDTGGSRRGKGQTPRVWASIIGNDSVLNSLNSGVYAAITAFLSFSMIQFRDGPFIRPHPAFWRVVLGVNLLYELALVFLLFQDLNSARGMMKLLDESLGVPLPEKGYADNCELTPETIWVRLDTTNLEL
jgi:hypothetical protein